MENSFYVFFVTAITALAAENAVFTRALGVDKTLLFLKSPKRGIVYGVVFTWMAVVTSFLIAGVNRLLMDSPYVGMIRAPAFCACIIFIYLLTSEGTRLLLPGLYATIRNILPITAFNTALFGAFYVSAIQSMSLLQTVGYAFGTGIGYSLAILIIYFARKRLSVSPVARSFRGLPILLVYIGLLSLALYGLIGHGLLS